MVFVINSTRFSFVVTILLGHSSLQCTEKHARAVDEEKGETVNDYPTAIAWHRDIECRVHLRRVERSTGPISLVFSCCLHIFSRDRHVFSFFLPKFAADSGSAVVLARH